MLSFIVVWMAVIGLWMCIISLKVRDNTREYAILEERVYNLSKKYRSD